jgi:hypothetical protein
VRKLCDLVWKERKDITLPDHGHLMAANERRFTRFRGAGGGEQSGVEGRKGSGLEAPLDAGAVVMAPHGHY